MAYYVSGITPGSCHISAYLVFTMALYCIPILQMKKLRHK